MLLGNFKKELIMGREYRKKYKNLPNCIDCGIGLSGKKANFKGLKSKEVYPIGFTNQLKNLIRIKDNHTCQICGEIQHNLKKKLHVHHIDYDNGNLSPKNLVSLCNSCHSKTNFNKKYWKNYFKNHNDILQNKTMENVLHDVKYMLEAMQKLKEICDYLFDEKIKRNRDCKRKKRCHLSTFT